MLFVHFLIYLLVGIVHGSNLIAQLPDGTQLQGALDQSIAVFKGIPYAEPPIGPLRFAPPVPYKNPNVSQVIDATKHGHACMQYLWGDDGLFDKSDEDCLTLNVFVNEEYFNNLKTNNTGSDDLLPVGIFIHGGSYITGSSFLPLYDGVDMIEYMKGKAILVTANYRLNAFGFLASDRLRSLDAESGSTGNYGIQDQRLAFQWVQNNIASFGGDPNQVTIFGESAGAGSMSNHLTMPKSYPFYNKVILESGSFGEWVSTDMTCGESMFNKILDGTRCNRISDEETIKCLQDLSPMQILFASGSAYVLGDCVWAPAVDGVEATTHPWIALSNGAVADVPILHGTNSDEGAIFTVLSHQASEQDLMDYWVEYGYTQDEIQVLSDLYLNTTYPDLEFASIYWWAAQRALGDNLMSCPAKYASQQISALSTHTHDVFMYHFEHNPRRASVTRHASEIAYVFHQMELLSHEKDALMADIVSSNWYNFLLNADPNGESIATGRDMVFWDNYQQESDGVMIFNTTKSNYMVNGLKENECAFAIPRLDKKIRSRF